MIVIFSPQFLRKVKKLEKNLQNEVLEKVAIFKKYPQNPVLKTHKLKGKLRDLYSFSVNYRYRIIFEYSSANQVSFLTIGTHDVYKQ